MESPQFNKIIRLYSQEARLLDSGSFGQGLWPLNPVLGQFLYWLIRLQGLTSGLEVGAGVGYSTAWFAAAFRQNGGNLTSLEYFPPKVEQLERHLQGLLGAEYEQTVQIVPSEFTTALKHVGRRKFDFVFFDQRKGDYLSHLQLLMPHLKNGAFICADNVLSHGEACQDYLRLVRNDARFASVCLSIADGVEVTRFTPSYGTF